MEATVPGISENPALFTAVNKDTAELHHELVPFDAALAQRLSDRAVNILRATEAHELLPRIATSPDHFECQRCPWSAGAGRSSRERRGIDGPERDRPAALARLQRRAGAARGRAVHAPRPGARADRRVLRRRVRLPRRYSAPRVHRRGQGAEGKPHNAWIPADADAAFNAAAFARWAAKDGAAFYVIPGTVRAHGQARAAEVAEMQTVLVDLDCGDLSPSSTTSSATSQPT